MWRHGDVLIAAAPSIPPDARRRPGAILAYGEVTGHSHRFEQMAGVELWEHSDILFAKVTTDAATIIHEEHRPITLPRGVYQIWMQREYTPHAIRRVVD